jgi:acetyl-CoA C-acetyltransferase
VVVDRNAPVIVGTGQVSQRVTPDAAKPPIELLELAARDAERDAAARQPLLPRVDVVAVVQIGSWRYPDPGALLARRLSMSPRATALSSVGGNSPQVLVNEFADRIQRGELDVVLIGGAESMNTRWRARREPRVELTWETGDDAPCEWVIGDERPGSSAYEMAHMAVAPTMVYPLFETALRFDAGHDIDEHQQRVSELWSTFSEVAATNPYAWSQVAYTPEEIRTVAPDNRMVCAPYPKRMCANIDVDQGAALLLTSYGAARDAGVADDRMVFVHSSAEAHDHWFVTERDTLTTSPAMEACYADTLSAAGVRVDDLAAFDLYSCFPSAVQLGMRALGLKGAAGGDSRPLTTTGGLGFAGGPVNNYPTHGIARMVQFLREQPEQIGLTTALGWYATKHAAAVWSARPPAGGFRRVAHAETQARVDALPSREPAGLVDETAVVEATSVAFERDGAPSVAIISALTADGRRTLANSREPEVMQSMVVEPWEGRSIRVSNDGTTNTIVV